MSDDNTGATTAAATRTSTSNSTSRQIPRASPPPGLSGSRRPATLDDNLRRRSTFGPSSPTRVVPTTSDHHPVDAPAGPQPPQLRRSSTFSDFALGEGTRDLINPKPPGVARADEDAGFGWPSVPLVLGLLPALAGVVFKNGSAVVTDVLLLGLASIFLHWSVTQPWDWYLLTQSIRVRERPSAAVETDDESDAGHQQPEATNGTQSPSPSPSGSRTTDDKQQSGSPPPRSAPSSSHRTPAQIEAQAELYRHEMLALVSCFVCPVLGTYLLHAIRGQLSRPSEGLVSDYNLAVFLAGAELRPLSQLVRLVKSRSLHVQRVVDVNPYTAERQDTATSSQITLLAERLEALESRVVENPPDGGPNGPSPTSPSSLPTKGGSNASSKALESALVRDVRGAVQPELDALNRAVRRYEKKATTLSLQTESRFGAMDTRLNDAIALATAAAQNSTPRPGLLRWAAESCVGLVVVPIRGLVTIATLPLRVLLKISGVGHRSDHVGKNNKGPRSRVNRGRR